MLKKVIPKGTKLFNTTRMNGTFSRYTKQQNQSTTTGAAGSTANVAGVTAKGPIEVLSNEIYNPSRFNQSSIHLGLPFANPFANVNPIETIIAAAFPNHSHVLPFKTNACESDTEFHFEAELPGVQKADVNVNIKDHFLTISALKKSDHSSRHDDKDSHIYHLEEHSWGKVKRVFRLPENIKADGIKAKMKDGMLFIDIPKSEVDHTFKKKKMIHIE